MRTRSLAAAVLMLGAATTMFMTGCSGKPENSPAIRKKFAEYDKTQKAVDEMSATVAGLSEEIKRLSNENSELRMMLPEGARAQTAMATTDTTATPATLTDTAAAPPTTQTAAIVPTDLIDQPLAGSVPAPAETLEGVNAPVAPVKAELVKETKQANKEAKSANSEKKALASTFKDKTTTAKPAVIKTSGRGKFHDIVAGETADTIAAKYGISKELLLSKNGIPAGAKLPKGQRLYIPASN